jgi:glutamate synthase (NADPH) small chain
MKFSDIVSPFLAWSRAAKKADTIPYPDKKNPGSDRYRGFHRNDTDRCIGCGRCEEICQNLAIGMVPAEETDPAKGDSGLRPKVDYGRCCWCALCVDVCSTGSLSLSNSYSWTTYNADTCTYVPGEDEKAWDDSPKGFRQDNAVLLWAGSPRVEMPLTPPAERVLGFEEVITGYTPLQASAEASRCIRCGLCVTACPAHMHIPEYIGAIADGDFEKAVRLFFDNNPLPEMCGKVCTRECESVCAMGYQGESIAIRWLKRFACEQFDSLSDVLGSEAGQPVASGKTAAIVGSGPAGLSAAYYLCRMGFEVHVFEKGAGAGGIAQHAIPEYRLPSEGYEKQMDVFIKAGVNFHFGSTVSPEDIISMAENNNAVFLAPGLQKSSDFRIPGIELQGVEHALYFLTDDPEKRKGSIGRRVLVIGGGNVAMDTARSCRRLGSEVIVSYRRRIEDMPADEEEIHEAIEEGIDIRTKSIPERIERTGQELVYFYAEAEMVDDPDGGRPKPVRKDDTDHEIVADTIFLAIGQTSDLDFLPEKLSELMDIQWGRIQVDENQHTGVQNIYAGGDITPGAGDVITAVADGIRAAKAIAAATMDQ